MPGVTRTRSSRAPRSTANAGSGGRTSIKPGDLLQSKTNDLGAGKALRKGETPGTIFLEYFDSPGQPAEDRHTEEVQILDLERQHLMSESRVYWQRSDAETRWAAGRVMSVALDGQVEVKSADGRDHLFHDVADLYVRWNRPWPRRR